MENLSEMNFPEDLRYAEDHEWAKVEDHGVRVGISDYAQDQLGDVTFVELPEADDSFKKGDAFGSVESTKAVSDLIMPVDGMVVEVNADLADSPGLVNGDPYGDGWMIVIKPDDPSQVEKLMTRDVYVDMLGGLH